MTTVSKTGTGDSLSGLCSSHSSIDPSVRQPPLAVSVLSCFLSHCIRCDSPYSHHQHLSSEENWLQVSVRHGMLVDS